MKGGYFMRHLLWLLLSTTSFFFLAACSSDTSESTEGVQSSAEIAEYRIIDDPLLTAASQKEETAVPHLPLDSDPLEIPVENPKDITLSLNYPLVLESASHDSSKSTAIADTQKDELPLKPATLQGFYIFGNETNLFSPCGSDKAYWVQTTPAIQSELVLLYRQLASHAHEEIFVQVTGKYAGQGDEGYAEDADGLFSIVQVHHMRRRAAGDCVSGEIERRE